MPIRLRHLILLALVASPASAETVVTCDTDDPIVATRVTFYGTSLHGPSYPGSLLDPDLTAVLASGFPSTRWKCSGSDVVVWSQADIDAQDAADLAAREAAALAAYGQECDLQSGDQLIGFCTAGEMLTSDFFQKAVEDVVKRRLQVADGQYVRREGALLVGRPARPTGAKCSGTATVTLDGTEQVACQLTITLDANDSKVALWGRANFVKDTGTTVRVVTMRIRREDATLIGVPCTVRSQGVASSEFGPCYVGNVDINPGGAGDVDYAITVTTPAGSTTAVQYELVAMEVQ